ncbi:MAG TPA: YfcC family protein [Candidatus Fimisoma avicola]|uniref:YfcC family protein n=1 Tax=Candidatus Fimisoma avicola TaxID=2840826 RepID=A0A9D1I578_9FIRM|nr:YfcC family protein [Candidatus Fimisoma avicola]
MSNNKKKGFSLPYPYIIIFTIMILVVILSYILPAGEYGTMINENTGQEVVNPEDFSYVENDTPIGFMDFFGAIHDGLVNGAGTYASLLLIAGSLAVLQLTGALDAGIHKILAISKGKEFTVVALLLLAFSSLGAIGFGEGGLPFVPVTVSVVMALGYDRMAGAATAFLGLSIGWTSGLLNILSTGICQNMAGLPLFSGLWLRFAGLVIFYFICLAYLYRYCNKIKQNPNLSLTADEYLTQNAQVQEDEVVPFTWQRKLVLLVFLAILVLQAYGAVKLGWALTQIGGLYVIFTILAIIIGRLNPSNACVEFTKGACQMMVVCVMIGLANAVVLLMNQGMIVDTLVHGMATMLDGKSPVVTLLLIYLAITIFNFFIVSGPGKAVIVMPILSPLASLLGINQQVITLTFCYADGITNYLYPTSGAMLAGMMLAGLDYTKWLKFFWKVAVIQIVVAFGIILFANAIDYGPF